MVLKSTPGASVAVYQVSGSNASRSLPDWLIKKRKQSLKKDPEFQSRVQLVQDFEFEEASNRIKVTRDGNYAMATGTYKPQIHVYDFQQMSMKFSRHTDAENVDFAIISDDWTKSVHLQSDRTIEFHAQGGIHTRIRIPKFGRSIDYNRENCDILVAGGSNELYRLNLDQGRFLAPFECNSPALNVVKVNPAHGLIGCGTESGTVEFWDPRTRRSVGVLGVGGEGFGIGSGVTALAYHNDGLKVAAGTYEGITKLYDLRMSEALLTKDQGYGYPIQNIGYLDTQVVTDKIWTSDKRIVKIWDVQNGDAFTSLEPTVDINDVAHIPNSGMFFLANEGIPMHTYYIPSIGPAPRWCSFLDNITEELEEKPVSTVYENFKFVTSKELRQLGLSHLIGTNVVRAYMHGYFIDMKLYEKAKLISNPYEYRDHREQEIRKRIESERQSRIRGSANSTAAVKVNKSFAAENRDKVDDRFKALFEDPEYEIDENSYEYKLLHGGRGKTRVATEDAPREGPRPLTAVEEEEISRRRGLQSEDESSDSENNDDERNEIRKEINRRKAEKRKIRKQKIDQQNKAMELAAANTARDQNELTLGERLQKANNKVEDSSNQRISGDTEISFVPKSKKKPTKPEGVDSGRKSSRADGSLRKASKNVFRGI
ncbi:ribosome biosynthesis protein [Starmerella bacillaris]|uniref:Ribosome biosynthesis protein n=1 Tax=Starmerella bacillaris TaxID=1247836 RepID=A0AAV5RE14_STABA|nr:ribosome biosynthesis protein [Starmerella bacillaris]